MARVCTYTNLIPFDGKLLTAKLHNRKANRNDLINHPSIMFSSNQLTYFEKNEFNSGRILCSNKCCIIGS